MLYVKNKRAHLGYSTCIFLVLNAGMAFNHTHAPYYCPATNNCKLCLLFTTDVGFVLRPLFLMDKDCIEKSRKRAGESDSAGKGLDWIEETEMTETEGETKLRKRKG